MEVFGFIFLWGIPLLLLWSFILTLVEVKRAGSEGQFLGRTLTFIGGIYHYTISSFAAWIGLIAIAFGIAALVKGPIFGALFFGLFGAFMVYNFFPRLNMPE